MRAGILTLKGRIKPLAIKYALKIVSELHHLNQEIIKQHNSENWRIIWRDYAKPSAPALANIAHNLGLNEAFLHMGQQTSEHSLFRHYYKCRNLSCV